MFEQSENINNYKQILSTKRSYWQQIIQEWQLNPIKPINFCSQKNLNIDQFGYWRRKFTNSNSIVSDLSANPNAGFIEVTKAGRNTVNFNADSKVNITLPNNIQLSLTVSMLHITDLIANLGGLKC